MSIEFTFAAIFIFFTSLKFSYPDSRTVVTRMDTPKSGIRSETGTE